MLEEPSDESEHKVVADAKQMRRRLIDRRKNAKFTPFFAPSFIFGVRRCRKDRMLTLMTDVLHADPVEDDKWSEEEEDKDHRKGNHLRERKKVFIGQILGCK
eukprot:3038906-Amphidinium_carterae.1